MKRLNQQIKNIKLRKKLYYIYFIAGLIPLLFLGTYFYMRISRLLIEREVRNQQNSLNQAVLTVENQLNIYENMSDYIAYNQTILQVVSYPYENYYEMYSQYTTVLDPLIASLKYFHNDIKRVTIYVDDDVIKHDTTLAPLTDIEEETWVTTVMNSVEIFWLIDQEKEEAIVARSIPQLNGISGLLYIEVDYHQLFEPFHLITEDNYGVTITGQDNSKIYSLSEFDKEYVDIALYSDNLENGIDTPESDYIQVSQEMDSVPWNVMLYRPYGIIKTSIRPIITGVLVAIVVCIVAAFVLLRKLARMLVREIENLTSNMEKVKEGNLEVEITSDAKDEMGELVRGFGDMVSRIKTLIEEVYESKISLKEYEMKALQAQINPHFLYNTLSIINWKAIEANEQDISKITLALSRFYRTALNRGKNIMSVQDEIENVKSYIGIKQIMHDHEFDVEYDVDEKIYYYDVPNLILQPLVENSIDHGIGHKIDGRGLLRIIGYMQDGLLYLSVEDNGIGMDDERKHQILTQESKGYGVFNVNERLKLFYGNEYELQIESELGKGTRTTVRIPARKEK